MNLQIEKDSRNTGIFFQKNKGIKGSTECKRQAMLDITKDCGEGKFFTQNYVSRECQVLDACKKILIVLELDTTIY
jgi:hypothetical protein